MPNPTSSNITAAIRTRRSNRQNRHRNNLFYVFNHPTYTNVFHYVKYFFLKSAFGRLAFVFIFIGLFYMYYFSRFFWPKIVQWLHNSTRTVTVSDEF